MLFRISSYSQPFTGSSVFSQTTGCWRTKLWKVQQNIYSARSIISGFGISLIYCSPPCFEGLVKFSGRFTEWKIIPPNESLFRVLGWCCSSLREDLAVQFVLTGFHQKYSQQPPNPESEILVNIEIRISTSTRTYIEIKVRSRWVKIQL